jgi:hypothetical protein
VEKSITTLRNNHIGVLVPEILLPAEEIDLCKWSVVACDQYTSQPEYWETVESIAGNVPSTLHLTFPEAYLEEPGKEDRIQKINTATRYYLNQGIVTALSPGFIYLDRKTTHAASRKGLILAVDLECYDYRKGSQTLIRATEGTVLDRLPPRIRVREQASMELPHIMVLIDDPDRTVIEPLAEKAESFPKLYDFELMMKGGHIRGYKVEDGETVSGILSALEKLADPGIFRSKYGVDEHKGVLLFAVGDGNHSLASAKGHWENVRKTLSAEEQEYHPARFALVEIVNVHDEGLQFEPIHRVVFNVDPTHLLETAIGYFDTKCSNTSLHFFTNDEEWETSVQIARSKGRSHALPFRFQDKKGVLSVSDPSCNLDVGTLQSFLDEYARDRMEMKIDYIHGDDVVTELSAQQGNIGFYLAPMDKCDLFKTVILDGVLPRKTFSMGEAEEKRFYLECRKIVK